MKALDYNYLLVQFKVKIYAKNGTVFQKFFEDIMTNVHRNFKIIPSGGGDGGNDGWIENIGRYYQVYSPEDTKIKDADAAKKILNDFNKLQKNWNIISEVKEYYFVYNDKYVGANKPEKSIAFLREKYPNIKFKLYLSNDLEKEFFDLSEEKILSLGFDIDQTKTNLICEEMLKKIELELDKENNIFASKLLNDVEEAITLSKNRKLLIERDILKGRCLVKNEKQDKAITKYKKIIEENPKEIRVYNLLAGVYLSLKDFENNKKYIEISGQIDNSDAFLKVQKFLRKAVLKEKIDLNGFNEKNLPESKREKSILCRFYAFQFLNTGDEEKAIELFDKAIEVYPQMFDNHVAKLSVFENKLYNENEKENKEGAKKILDGLKDLEEILERNGEIDSRNRAGLDIIKSQSLFVIEDYEKFLVISQQSFDSLLNCFFDREIENYLILLLSKIITPAKDVYKLLNYLSNTEVSISNKLCKIIIFQMLVSNTLKEEGKSFFRRIKKDQFYDFIDSIENENYEKISDFIKDDIEFSITLANTLKDHPELRKKIIENLPDNNEIQKEKIKLLLNFDEEEYDSAFEILKNLNLSKLNYFECQKVLKVVQIKKAYDFSVIIIEKLLQNEQNKKNIFDLKLLQLENLYQLERYVEAIKLGEELISIDNDEHLIEKSNQEVFIVRIVESCMERGKVDPSYFKKAENVVRKYEINDPSFEFKVGVITEVCLKNDKPKEALDIVLDAIKKKKILNSEEIAKLYFIVFLKIGNRIELNLHDIDCIIDSSFVKFEDDERWYYIGDDNSLDAFKLGSDNDRYGLLIGASKGDKIIYNDKYSSDEIVYSIERILGIDSYILWKINENFNHLARVSLLPGIQRVKVIGEDGTFDTNHLIQLMKDLGKDNDEFFKEYCDKTIPLAMLSIMEGSITRAIGRIKNEERGFIRFSTGDTKEFEKQKEIANRIVNNNEPFYIDGTSAIFLSEFGLFKEIYKFIEDVKTPQSVIQLLSDLIDRFRFRPFGYGFMGYSKGKIHFSKQQKDISDKITSNLIESIKFLETNILNICAISNASKADCFSEQKVPGELCDACVMAKNEHIPILTEDYYYLMMNEIETNDKAPESFSSLALVRTLYEMGIIEFEKYLDYFGYLSTYRFRFLALNVNDIEKAVFGDKIINVVSPTNIQKFNFKLTLAEEYGVTFNTAFKVILGFMINIITDNTITPDIVEKIFFEIVESYPTKFGKYDFCKFLIHIIEQNIEKNEFSIIVKPKNKNLETKLDKLKSASTVYYSQSHIWHP